MDDATAVRSCRDGDIHAFKHVVERYQREAIGHALAIVGNRQDAEDALQEAFLDAFRALRRFDERRRFYPWFYTILRNRCLKLVADRRRQSSERLETLELLSRQDDAPVEAALALEEGLRQLSPEGREVLTLRHLDGLSYKDLSIRLGVPIGTVMSRLYYARQQLRARLSGEKQ